MDLDHFRIEKSMLDPDPPWEKQLDSDPQKMNADPQSCYKHVQYKNNKCIFSASPNWIYLN